MINSIVHLIGVDCATRDAKVGLAFGRFEAGEVVLEHADVCTRESSAAKQIAWRLTSDRRPALIAIDAPLGWPAPMGCALASHRAGDLIDVDSSELFRRETDRYIKRTINKMPLDVGADRIGRTAHSSLRLLADLRSTLGEQIPLAWSPTLNAPVSAIEVYPGATLAAHGLQSSKYKPVGASSERDTMIGRMHTLIRFESDTSALTANADVLDAAVCLIAAGDFLVGEASPPEDFSKAVKEGWIWCRPKP